LRRFAAEVGTALAKVGLNALKHGHGMPACHGAIMEAKVAQRLFTNMPGNIPFVEFVGGPLDGYRRDVPDTPATLPDGLEHDVSQNTFRIMAGMPRMSETVTTSTVAYELAGVNDLPRYYFIGAVKPLG
jgi:hypothetical protein